MNTEKNKDLDHWRSNAEENYDQTPISVLKYISKLEKELKKWIPVEEQLPDELETVWISNGKGFTTLGCLSYDCGWHWAVTNGIIYEEQGKIVSECESDDLDVKFWSRIPETPK